MKIILLFLIVAIAIPYCYCAAVVDSSSTSASEANGATQDIDSPDMTVEINAENVEIMNGRKDDCKGSVGPTGPRGLQGPTGPRGLQGPEGPEGLSGGGALYTRWGKTDCPSTNGTDRVYEGLAAGGYYHYYGGGSNYLCITKTPQYLSSSASSSYSRLYGAEYKNTIMSSLSNNKVPCAVCHTSERSSKLMIPGTLSCPTSWTEEYDGYLMTSYHSHNHATTFECVDKNSQAATGVSGSSDGALFYHVGAQCGYGLPCSSYFSAGSYVANRAMTCVVCTK